MAHKYGGPSGTELQIKKMNELVEIKVFDFKESAVNKIFIAYKILDTKKKRNVSHTSLFSK